MATQEEIDQARAAGIRAAAQAQAIADAAEPSLLDRVEAAGSSLLHAVEDPITNAISGATTTAGNAVGAAADTASQVLNVFKWVGIVILVLVALLAFLWLAFAVFGLVWAGNTLRAIVPGLAPAAVAVARASR